jgi:hypothetical protein
VDVDKEHQEILKEVKSCPVLKKSQSQIHAVSGIGVTSLLGSVGLEAMNFLGENVAEIVGGGTGVGVVVFFIAKFFITEMGEMNNI